MGKVGNISYTTREILFASPIFKNYWGPQSLPTLPTLPTPIPKWGYELGRDALGDTWSGRWPR